MNGRSRRPPRRRDDRGQVGGWEAVPFGLLVFLVGTLLVANAWAVVDARIAVGDAARAGTRAYVSAPDQPTAEAEAVAAARQVVAAHGGGSRATVSTPAVDPRFARCAVVTVTVETEVPALVLPFVGGFGHGFRVTGRHRGVIDPYRSGGPAESVCG